VSRSAHHHRRVEALTRCVKADAGPGGRRSDLRGLTIGARNALREAMLIFLCFSIGSPAGWFQPVRDPVLEGKRDAGFPVMTNGTHPLEILLKTGVAHFFSNPSFQSVGQNGMTDALLAVL
jgi:hypothetical protein